MLVPLRRDLLDPVPALRHQQETSPVAPLTLPFGARGWLVTGHAEARVVLAASADFSNDFEHLVGRGGIAAEDHPGGLGFTDPPEHTRLRKLVSAEFTVRRLARLAPRIEAIVAGQLDRLAAVADDEGRVDLVEHFARPIPLLTICDLLGIRDADRAEFQRVGADRFDLLGGTVGALGAVSESLERLTELVRRERANPGDGLLGMLVQGDGAAVSDRALAGLVDGLLTGGLETTASMLALGVVVLLDDSDRAAALRGNDALVLPYVEELLRYLSVVQVAFPRFARHDVGVGGHEISAGDVVVCSLSAANRDPRSTPDGDRVDVTRPMAPHLAFGYGVHRCVGAELARMELRCAYPALIRRYPALRLAHTVERLPFRELSFVYGLDALPVLLA